VSTATHAEDISGSCAECFQAIADFESYPAWQSAVAAVEVRSRDEAGRGREVAFVIDLKLRHVRYALIYEYTEPTEIRWTYAGGEIRDLSGSYSFRETGTAGIVQARYTLNLDVGFHVPALVRRGLQREMMHRSVRELKARVEARAEA
jgi:ribosome-associated toxin RatA of RatAB toxin-antitoxin module